MIMIKLYAPADTEAVPILRKKERKIKRIAKIRRRKMYGEKVKSDHREMPSKS